MSRTRTTSLAAFAAAAVLTAPHPAQAEARQAQDFFVGNGTVGPYTLSWKHILAGTETVQINGMPVTWGMDYTLDPDAGTLTFTHPLPAQAGAVIHYGYDPKSAQAQGGGLNLPLAFALNENVSVSGIYNHAATDGNRPGALNMGLNGGWQGANDSKLATHLLFVPALTGTDAKNAPNGLARLGFAANGETRIGKPLQVSFGFSRAGAGVGSLGSDNWKAGLQKLNLGGTYTPSKQVQATFGYIQTDPANGKGAAQSQINAALALTPSDKMQINTNLSQTQGGGSGPVQTLAAVATLKPSDKTELDAAWSQKDTQNKAHNTQDINLKAALTEKNLALTAGVDQGAVGTGGATQTLNATMSARPNGRTELDATFAQKNAPGKGGDTQDVKVKAALALSPNLSLNANVGEDSTGPSDKIQTLGASAVIKPTGTSELDATFAQKDAPGTNSDTQNLDIKAALAPTKTLALTASLNQSSQGAQDTSAQAVRLSLTPRPTLQFNTSVSMRKDPTTDTQVTGVDGRVQPWAFLLVSGAYQWRTVTAVQPGAVAAGDFDSSAAQFTIAPKGTFHLIGTYAQNPTDKNGNLQHLAQHGLGLQTTIGALALTTDYNWTQFYATPTTGTSLHVGIGLRFSANTQLTGDYKQDLTGLGLDPTGTNAYSLGLTRNLGDAFNLSLSGTMKQNVSPGTPTPDDITAAANLGMKF